MYNNSLSVIPIDNNSLLEVIRQYDGIISKKTNSFHLSLSEMRESRLVEIISMLSKYEDCIINYHNKFNFKIRENLISTSGDAYGASKVSEIEYEIISYIEYRLYIHYLIDECTANE